MPSVLSRFRLAGALVVLAISVVGAVFYGFVNRHYLGIVIGRTLGPYSDSLSEHVFATRDPDLWRKIAARHRVAMVVELPDGTVVAIDNQGEALDNPAAVNAGAQIKAVRESGDGARLTFYWTLWSFGEGHLPLLAGLVVMVLAVFTTAFWFLQRQLKPLTWLHGGVEAVAAGDFKARVAVVRDDEIGQVARAFNDMTGRVGRMMDDRERLLADVSHELRSPISRMKVALEFIPEGDKRDALDRDLREMESLITALLEREALRSHTGIDDGGPVDLGALAREAVGTFTGESPGVEVTARRPVEITGDAALIKLLIHNLVDNAVKFSQPDSRPVEVIVADSEAGIVLCVRDDGIGIPAGSEEDLFKPFVKLDRARGHHAGYGIGLNLCSASPSCTVRTSACNRASRVVPR